jgi:hypothetical protein
MKRNQLITTVAAALLWCNISVAQDSDSLGVIGDDLDLYAVLDAFKDAESIEAFEKTINSEDAKINNLDLDEDGQIDYITVNDEGEGDVHAFILSIDMSEEETQDVAVIELEKTNSNEATIQIVGDEEIYGKDYIIEPKNPDEITKRLLRPNVIIVNVWGWRGVRFVYAPGYTRWRSPWRWNRHPRWWRPWRPVRWRVYNGWHVHQRRYYHPVRTRRCVRAHGFYVKKRRTCVKIKKHKHHHGNKQAKHNGNNHGNHNGHNHGNHNGHHKDQKANKGDKKPGNATPANNGSKNQGQNKNKQNGQGNKGINKSNKSHNGSKNQGSNKNKGSKSNKRK